MDKRKEELEKKRQKLAELRKAREERKTTLKPAVSAPSVPAKDTRLVVPENSYLKRDMLISRCAGSERCGRFGLVAGGNCGSDNT